MAQLRDDFTALERAGCTVLSPESVDFTCDVGGFVLSAGQEDLSPASIERTHLDAIPRARFMWVHCPQGYVGVSAALEIGAAHAAAVPVFGRERPVDLGIADLVTVVKSPGEALTLIDEQPSVDPGRPLRGLQHYYGVVAEQRGWGDESPMEGVLLLAEELGELARAVRHISALQRHQPNHTEAADELADIQLYVVHLANTLGIDLAEAVTSKEAVNARRFAHSQAASA